MPALLGYAEWDPVPATNQNPKTGLKPNIFTRRSTNHACPENIGALRNPSRPPIGFTNQGDNTS